MRSKYGRRTLALIISENFHGAAGLRFMDFDLTGACLSRKVLSEVPYFSPNCDKSALELVIYSDFTMSSLNARMSMS